uniref:TBCC domain-containing protein 1 n=1 Tax=Polytomella parva TaxID=51329 RepID=A0A7S0V4B7_9CHLO|mmetsp:Transcript_30202/g.55185  ORF Transcript_30202/g.55185 Transcript_30202/m.55185 type:complete len:768 (+) Transcript_30202:175-2478(+)|eukprot:CAMPEP_0175063244 /NCGR_PEP_ID=MMETSP0052_2-20121109/14640_1 /TAXON_ID=51329 ORGANISM="Polytomella parva, Strain SAG 63-3" /NCGR_SAMPLE_ID=MMETSP0052_2 /ASSEMBLY_ACC=CAM_ASM_000194 /LENGTH=767 /DNA_ID=CAMNT_0016329403 /DNA_START=158 /DNA_END=2461 /DNA_ORIENTATION=+
MQPRKEVLEYGLLPMQTLCPQVDSITALQHLFYKLYSASVASSNGKRIIRASDVMTILDLNNTQYEVIQEILSALSTSNVNANGLPVALGMEQVFLHELACYLLVLMYSRESIRLDTADVWPENAPNVGPSSTTASHSPFGSPGGFGGAAAATAAAAADALLSPTRAGTGTSSNGAGSRSPGGGRSLLRQQLQQHLKQQVLIARGLSEFLRRHLRVALEFVSDTPPPLLDDVLISSSVIDRLDFLFTVSPSNNTAISSSSCSALGSLSSSSPTTPLSTGTSAIGLSSPHNHLLSNAVLSAATMTGMPLVSGNGSAALLPKASPSWPLPLDLALGALKALWGGDAGTLAIAASGPLPAELVLGSLSGLESPRTSLAIQGGSPRLSPCRSPGGSSTLLGSQDYSHISGVVKGSVVRGEDSFPGGDLHVSDCHDSVVYALAPLRSALVAGCSDCTIVLGAVGRLVRIERCDRTQILCCGNRIIVSSCHDCTFFLGTPRGPIFVGDNRFLRLAPFNTRYERQVSHIVESGVRSDLPNLWNHPILLQPRDRRVSNNINNDNSNNNNNGSNPPPSKACYSLLPPDEFLPFVVPFVGGTGPLAGGAAPSHVTRWGHLGQGLAKQQAALQQQQQQGGGGGNGVLSSSTSAPAPSFVWPLPTDYSMSLQKKLGMTHELRTKFKQVGLSREKERELNDSIQAYFKDWLYGNGSMLRQVYDLSLLEKEEMAAATALSSHAGSTGVSIPPFAGFDSVGSAGGGGGATSVVNAAEGSRRN